MAGSTGTVTVTETNTWGGLKLIQWAWLTGSSSQAHVAPATATTYTYCGKVISCTFSPSASAQPDDDYDLTITNSNGWDILNGAGANCDEATTEHKFNGSTGADTYRMLPVVNSQLTLNITNAGSETSGVIYLVLGM